MARSRFALRHRVVAAGKGGVDQHGNARGCGHQLAQELQPLCDHFTAENIDSRRIATWAREAGDKTKLDRIFGDREYDRDGRRCRLARKRGRVAAGRDDDGHLAGDQLGRHLRQPMVLPFGPAVRDRHVLALGVADLLEALAKSAQTVGIDVGRCGVEEADHRHHLLRAGDARPSNRRAA
jgi:hypothetical protein